MMVIRAGSSESTISSGNGGKCSGYGSEEKNVWHNAISSIFLLAGHAIIPSISRSR